MDGVPVVVLPPDLAPALSEMELVADIWSADVRAAREHANLTVAVTRLARRRRCTDLAARGVRGGPGPDARRLASPVLADVSEDFVHRVGADPLLLGGRGAAAGGGVDPAHRHAGRDLGGAVRRADHRAQGPARWSTCSATYGRRSPARSSARVLPRAEDRPVGWLRDAIRRQLARLDAEALDAGAGEAAAPPRRAAAAHRRRAEPADHRRTPPAGPPPPGRPSTPTPRPGGPTATTGRSGCCAPRSPST